MSEKIVRAVDDIIFESADITIPKGCLFFVEQVTEEGVILETTEGERYLIDFTTFEAGFEIAVSGNQ